MVEPPIKKSDRKPKPETETGNEVTVQSTPQKKSFAPPIKKDPKDRENSNDRDRDRDRSKGRGKDKGRGRKSSGRDEVKAGVNPALARPPKPSKPPVKVEPEPEEASETVGEESQDSTEPATEVVGEESQDSTEAQN
ncbi:hypothetical protein NIES267_04190 [Calothrix parasitica NIES-267]|uniref:Uncharacterized protein n=1 Tax=Calothrix parasitica NIES-267 TaxID=1973488 RepID=A0A1Z4LIE6_9CYAN|nr:hypothetical protein NIES267_04190 [Calothrix parasitica NIES-267]